MTLREDVTAALGRAIVLVVALLVVAACNGDDDEATNIDDQPVLEVQDATGPLCMQVDPTLPPEVKTLPIIDCAEAHTHEIYATVPSPEPVFPGVEALGDFAQVKCLEAFEPFVGTSPFDSALSYSWLVPTLQSWNDDEDRTVLCVLMNRDSSPLVGTMRDAQV